MPPSSSVFLHARMMMASSTRLWKHGVLLLLITTMLPCAILTSSTSPALYTVLVLMSSSTPKAAAAVTDGDASSSLTRRVGMVGMEERGSSHGESRESSRILGLGLQQDDLGMDLEEHEGEMETRELVSGKQKLKAPTGSRSPPPKRKKPPPKSRPSPPRPPPPPPSPPPPTPRVCLDRLTTDYYVAMEVIPGSPDRVLLAQQSGVIQLAQLPPASSASGTISIISTFLDLSARVVNAGERGLLGLALHPNFENNGRFFVSYICDANRTPDCKSACVTGASVVFACRSDTNTIVAEYSATSPSPLAATAASPAEVPGRRLLQFARPFTNHAGGDIFFGEDGYLYYTSGDGGGAGDPYRLSQKGRNFFGKILRLDVDNTDGQKYGIPPSNPFRNDSRFFPEVFALGFRNPWRCTQDSGTKWLVCVDVGQNVEEEVNIVRPGFNYQWNRLEGSTPYDPAATLNPYALGTAGPIFRYQHSPSLISIVGGVVYRSKQNTCLKGKYLFSDYLGSMFIGNLPASQVAPTIQPTISTPVPYACNPSSPIACLKSFGLVVSWAKDVAEDAYMLSTLGVYRVTKGSKCGIAC